MKTVKKIDLYKLHSAEYAAPRRPAFIETKPARYLAIVGRGEPGGDEFQAKLGALYNVAFTIKMASKFAGKDYAVCKLEGLWWGSGKKANFMDEPRHTWNWKLLIRVPDFIDKGHLKEAVKKLKAAGKPATVGEVGLESLNEGRSVQMLHVGAYEEETRTIEQTIEFATTHGLSISGLHHEIYLSDPRRVEAGKLRTILRYPVK